MSHGRLPADPRIEYAKDFGGTTAGGGAVNASRTARDVAVWQIVIRPDARLWSFRLSGGMSVSTFMRTLAPVEERKEDA